MNKQKVLNIGILLVSIFLFSCNNNTIFKDSSDIPENTWQINDTLIFCPNISDVDNYYNLFINIDADKDFLTDNIWLIIDSESPSGNVLHDTVMFFISDDKGKWFGKQKGDIIRNKFLYKTHIRFPEKGQYTFRLRHGMRKNDLPRISSAGISIEKAE